MALIRANRESIDDRFSVLGFTVRTDLPLFEVGLATDPELLKAENRERRTTRNFFSSRLLSAGGGSHSIPGGREAVYLVPPTVVARFVGQSRLYFGVATYQDKDRSRPISVKVPDAGHMYVSLSGLTERGLRRTVAANGQGPNGHALVWGGDALAGPATNGANGNGASSAAARNGNGVQGDAPGTAAPYSDGYPDELWQQANNGPATAANGNGSGNGGGTGNGQAAIEPSVAPPATAQAYRAARSRSLSTNGLVPASEDARRGIEGPIPDDMATARAQARSPRALTAPTPEYPQADRFVAAHAGNFRATSGGRSIERVVIHITDGGANINGTIGWFQNPDAGVSAHYVIGQDGEVVQMVRHDDVAWHARSANGTSIGIEHVANTRGLNPTPAQMCASAALVTWLCDQYGIPVDRTHILGHAEADTATTHTGCPNAVWDWTYYMSMVTSRTCHEPDAATTTQGLRTRGGRAFARAQEIIAPFYDPSNPATALQCTQDAFSLAREEWFAGVSDTRQFPHSAICQLIMTKADGSQYQGTGFYIGRKRILTCAHNLHGKASVRIIPGRNGSGAKPFGETTVNASSWRVAPRYTGSGDWDNDLAVIDNVPLEAPHGQFFRFLNATPSTELPVVVCGYSAGSRKVPQLDVIIDGDKQHLHGGYVSEAPTPDTIDYPILSLMGASGSPVYTVTGSGGDLQARICAVHVSGEPVDRGLNRGCFITPAKIDWIEGRATSFALDAEGGDAAEVDPDSIGIREDEPVVEEVATQAQARGSRALAGDTPDYPDASRFAAAHANNFTRGRRSDRVLDRIVIHITAGGPSINGTIGWFQNGNRVNERTGKPIRSSAHYVVGRDGEVVQMVHDGDTAHHASQANSRSIGIEHNANKPGRSNPRDLPPTEAQYEASARLVAWLCQQHGLPADREHIRGHHEISPADNHDCPSSIWDWDHYMACVHRAATGVTAPAATAQGMRQRAYARAQEIITPFYDPLDPASALVCQADAFSQAREEWFAGVPKTTIFPHSAVCLLEMKNAAGNVTGRGTGFYIGANRILTCGHNLFDAGTASVDVVPGKNGQGGGTEPFGRFNVPRSQWRIPASYGGSNPAFDLAVIDNVPNAAPNGWWFNALEELRESRPEGVVVCGYSSRSDRVPELTAAIDGFKQHLHAGYIAALGAGDSTFDYPIMTLKRASGSPVYYLSDKDGELRAYVVGVHTSSVSGADDVNRGCRLTDAKIAWIEGRSTTLGLSGPARARALQDDGPSDLPVELVPQPDKNSCWAAAMAMLLAYRGRASFAPESLATEVGASLATSYGWDLLNAVRDRFHFEVIEQPSNTSLYHSPRQWARWLHEHGPLWVVIVGAPHAVVVAGIRGNLDDPSATEVKILNPWDTRVAFDADPVIFNPPNGGYEDWLSFADFAADFGNLAADNYGNWRVLHLPAAAASAQSLGRHRRGLRLAHPPAAVRALQEDGATGSEQVEAIEPSRIAGTRMQLRRGQDGASSWALEQLEGMKAPAAPVVSGTVEPTEVHVDLGAWPALEGEPTPLPLTVSFRAEAGAVGDVRIRAAAPAVPAPGQAPAPPTDPGVAVAEPLALDHGVDVMARIEDSGDVDGVAALKVGIDYRFVGLAEGSPLARIELRLLGDGRHERRNRWVTTA